MQRHTNPLCRYMNPRPAAVL